ncbi:LemA family protein [Sphingomonas montanisoli]|uniref:LemA family protein n=1 Tax=Sphingomonas montanisoli TaxID=2606412 RepID=A0A5D9C6Z0_9SPHN|nr:LemA family protein [Sphingomonas montanisoli]TZG27449.1 LemA family protein [Sphingomonas montanisoli]
MTDRRFSVLMLAPVAAIAVSGCGINSVPAAQEEAKAKWADVQTQYQRRADLIPNLVNTVKGYAKQESTVLTDVTNARARATGIQLSADDLSDPAKVKAFADAQGQLSGSLSRLLVASENYPDLKSSDQFMALQSQLEGTENRIAISRRDYNESVRSYNTLIRTFPTAIGAKVFHGAQPMQPFEAAAGSDKAPSVSF